MVDISILTMVRNQLITGGHHPVGYSMLTFSLRLACAKVRIDDP